MKIRNKNYNLDNKLNKKIVLISDIHYKNKKDIKRLNYVLDNIKKINPDYICIPGDIIDKSKIKDEDYFIEWLSKLAIICKIFVSIGNHEFYKNKNNYGLNKEFFNKVDNIKNVYLLDNKNVVIDNINFVGITVPMWFYSKTYKKEEYYTYVKKLKFYKKYYNILLCHSPENISDEQILKNTNINLILSGHMHGGIVPNCLRFIFQNKGLIGPYKNLFPKIAYGYLKLEKTNIIITSGLKVVPYKIINKFFASEIVEISI